MVRPPQWFKQLVVPIADKIVYSSNAYVSMKSTLNDLSSTLVTFEGEPADDSDMRLLEFATIVKPVKPPESGLTRVGGDHDGGYVMALPVAAVGAVSIGVGSDVSWDKDIGLRGIPVSMFDHTVRGTPESVPNGTFHRIGVAPRDEARTRTLSGLVSIAGFEQRGDLFLKMDVEGAEWNVLKSIHPQDLERFSQIVLELHGLEALRDPTAASGILDSMRQLVANHCPIHVHANNYDDLVRYGKWWFPNAIEVSLVRRDMLDDRSPATTLRTDLDRPCDPRVQDIDLSALTRI